MARRSSSQNNSTANLGFEAKLWLAADKLRGKMNGLGSARDSRAQIGALADRWLVQSEKFVEAHGGKLGDISLVVVAHASSLCGQRGVSPVVFFGFARATPPPAASPS